MCLCQAKSLKTLHVMLRLETHQASEFASALKQNSSLLTLCVYETTDEGIKIIKTISMQHPTLLQLELPGGEKYNRKLTVQLFV